MISLIIALLGALNPVVTSATLARTICHAGWTATIRPSVSYTAPLKRRLAMQVGISVQSLKYYELDHIVPLEVGGAPRDLVNLWLQPWNGPAGAHAKDRVENQVHRDICTGRITLAQGQAVFQGDTWQTYRRP